jgi:hypothetical protein
LIAWAARANSPMKPVGMRTSTGPRTSATARTLTAFSITPSSSLLARYQYEYFEAFTDEEQQAVETRWLERGAAQDEADVVTYAPEVDALIAGLRSLIEPRLSSPAG